MQDFAKTTKVVKSDLNHLIQYDTRYSIYRISIYSIKKIPIICHTINKPRRNTKKRKEKGKQNFLKYLKLFSIIYYVAFSS